MLVLTNLPYWLGYVTTPDELFFTGLLMNPEDSNTYFAKMLQGYEGAWRYTITFTTEPHNPEFVGVFYLLLGHIARWFSLSVMAIWHLSRNVAGMFLFIVVFYFIRAFVPGRKPQTIAYLLSLFGSGLGWVLFLLGQNYWLNNFPVDFKMPEAHPFFTALTFPHVAAGTAMLLLSLWGVYRILYEDGHGWRLPAGLGLLNLLILIAYPFLIYLLLLISGLNWLYLTWQKRLINWRKTGQLALTYLIPLPLIGYYVVVLSRNPVFEAWDLQAGLPSPPWPHYLISFGLMLLLGLVHLTKHRPQTTKQTFLWLWVLAVVLLVYAPLRPQRRFVQGVHVALSILTAVSFTDVIWPWLRETRPMVWLSMRPRYTVHSLERFVLFFLYIFMSLSNVYLLLSVILTATVQKPFPLYRPAGEQTAIEWLDQNTLDDDILLGHYQTGNFVSGRTGRLVVVGHWAETTDFEQRLDDVERFYQAETTAEWRRQFLETFNVVYVWYGPEERDLGSYDPAGDELLRSVYEQDGIEIYTVDIP